MPWSHEADEGGNPSAWPFALSNNKLACLEAEHILKLVNVANIVEEGLMPMKCQLSNDGKNRPYSLAS